MKGTTKMRKYQVTKDDMVLTDSDFAFGKERTL